MARQLESFPAPSTRQYPWEEWLDGGVWELSRGEDFSAKPATLISNARSQAKRRGGNLRTRLVGEVGREAIVLQFSRETR
jgi:hypothetical protein